MLKDLQELVRVLFLSKFSNNESFISEQLLVIGLNINNFNFLGRHAWREFPSSGRRIKLEILQVFSNKLNLVHLLVQHSHGWQSSANESFNRANFSQSTVNVVSEICILIHS